MNETKRRLGARACAASGLTLAVVAACAAPEYQESRAIRGLEDGETVAEVGHQNWAKLDKSYSEEWKLAGHEGERPDLGIALSGGGVRSAAFCMGVLEGLASRQADQETSPLERVDVISGVSGGGYTLGWLLAQHRYDDRTGRRFGDLLSDDGRYAEAVATHARGSEADGPWDYYIKSGMRVGLNVISIPFGLIEDGIFDWGGSPSLLAEWYEDALERTYIRHPDDTGDGFSNVRTGWLSEEIDPEFKLADVRTAVESDGLPIPVFNTTARVRPRAGKERALLSDAVYEFTPYGAGSDGFGDRQPFGDDEFEDLVNLSDLMAVSGAAVDGASPDVGIVKGWLLRFMGWNLGRDVLNRREREVQDWLLPIWPLYLFQGNARYDANARHIYLSDGGHAENLGAYSLIRRACETIVIVDAEYEGNVGAYRFDAYQSLKKALLNEMKLDLSVPAIDEYLEPTGNVSKYRHGAVAVGEVANVPIGAEPVTLRVVYVKLGIDWADTVVESSEDVMKYRDCDNFPQTPTADQNYSAGQFDAYRALGRIMGQRAADEL